MMSPRKSSACLGTNPCSAMGSYSSTVHRTTRDWISGRSSNDMRDVTATLRERRAMLSRLPVAFLVHMPRLRARMRMHHLRTVAMPVRVEQVGAAEECLVAENLRGRALGDE